jgi:hypothetical protein
MFSHFKIHQKVSVVKKLDEAYTSASTAENQKVSEKFKVNAPTIPENMIAIDCQPSASPLFTNIFFARCVIVQNINMTVKALVTAETIFTQKATLVTSSPAIKEKTLPIIKKSGAPGG